MTNNLPTAAVPSTSQPVPAAPGSPTATAVAPARFAMVALYVDDLQRSVDFYRLVGLDLPDPRPDRPVVVYREGGQRRIVLATQEVGRRFDPDRTVPGDHGYRHAVEFFVDDDDAVDAAWTRLTTAGFEGVSPPATPNGAYATQVRDPDGNVVMITHEP